MLGLMAAVAVLGAPAASAACPNEAFRTGLSALLPECRAYEQVTPVDKESGVAIVDDGGAHVAPSGDGIFFYSRSAYAGQEGSIIASPYLSTRAGETWATQGIGGRQANFASVSYIATIGSSNDLTYSLVASKEALAPGAVPFGSNLYIRDNRTATYTTVVARQGDDLFRQWTNTGQSTPVLAGGSADWGTVLLQAESAFRPGDEVNGGALYEFRGGELHYVANEAFAASKTEANPNEVSVDGRRFYYVSREKLYLHELGREPLVIDKDENGEEIRTSENGLLGATPDGGIAIFRSGYGLYRFEASAPAGEQVTNLLPASSPFGQVTGAFAGEDGTFAYFGSPEQLTPDAKPLPGGVGLDLYAWHGEPGQAGQVRYIGQSDYPGIGVASVSPDGHWFGFESLGKITPDAVDGPKCFVEGSEGCQDVFLYSFDQDRMVCVSCSGAPAVGYSRIGAAGTRVQGAYTSARPVFDDGWIFFDSPNPISARDTNGVGDTYGWHAGRAELVSGGTDRNASVFVGATPDVSDVFFRTTQGLVGQDVDSMTDLYDARVGGGLPQSGPPAPPDCIAGNGCRSGVVADVPPVTLGSSTLQAAGNVPGACSALRAKAQAARKRSRALARRAGGASGERATALRKSSKQAAKTARRLGRRAGNCTGGAR